MKVTVSDRIYQPRVMELERALEPKVNSYGESIGIVEEASQQAELNAECIGRLLAWLVESKRMDIETAKDISGVNHDIEPIVETPEYVEQQARWQKDQAKPEPESKPDPRWLVSAPVRDHWECPNCSEKFTNNFQLQSHINTKHCPAWKP